mgnify:CR=1 FL=1
MGTRACPHAGGPSMPHVWGQTTSESPAVQFEAARRSIDMCCHGKALHGACLWRGYVLAEKAYILGFLFT